MKIVILGLGRLGQRIYHKLTHHEVWGTFANTPKGLVNEVKFNFDDAVIPAEILKSDAIVFNLTPSAIDSLDRFKKFLNNIETQKFLFITSTSVYGNQGEVNEDTKPNSESSSGKLLYECEKYLAQTDLDYTVIRPGGLYSDTSHPGEFLSARDVQASENEVVNLIHYDDLADLAIKALDDDKAIINAININHPNKAHYYTQYCEKHKLPLPNFSILGTQFKLIQTKYSEYEIKKDLP